MIYSAPSDAAWLRLLLSRPYASTAGVYHVASQLAACGFDAAVDYGNAPSVDIVVGRVDSSASLSLQVKTSY